jgi:hypothetical protein
VPQGFLAMGVASAYALTIDLAFRHPVHLGAIIVSAGLVLSHLMHFMDYMSAGVSVAPEGKHVYKSFVPKGGNMLALSFGPVFIVSIVVNVLGFIASRDKANCDSHSLC